ncbi:26152_t:CDS:2 [Racocetra persica]|uniref:26152_t:CDS:1 n=1 Tax=Racocetra persica TaxID=160502 RepID=A0ACA9NJR8_9GLOM|nr:26152_t:CDS:2 [Racocetra persica]
MELLLTAKVEEVDLIFNELFMSDKNLTDWVQYYKKHYIIASLNPNISKIPNNLWYAAPNNTNCAKAAHAMSNQEGKQLKLMTAILRFASKRQSKACSSTKKQNKKRQISQVIDLTVDIFQESQKINLDNNESKESDMTMLEKLEYEERLLMIAECKEKLRANF